MASPTKTSPSPKSPLTTSKATAPIPTPTYPTGGTWTILTSTTISAPPRIVFAASNDSSTWPAWNSFTPRTEPSIVLSVGSKLDFYNKMGETGPADAKSTHEFVEVSEDFVNPKGKKGYRIVWKTIGMPAGEWLMWAERVQEIVEGEDEQSTQYKTWGTFGGPMATGMSWFGIKDQVAERFEDWANDLKEYSEKKYLAES